MVGKGHREVCISIAQTCEPVWAIWQGRQAQDREGQNARGTQEGGPSNARAVGREAQQRRPNDWARPVVKANLYGAKQATLLMWNGKTQGE